jgi:hypothetical protein
MSSRRLLRVLSRPWAAESRASKTTTGLVGVPVIPDSVAVLQTASARVLAAVAKHVPASAHYRRQVEAVYQGRLDACKAHGTAEGVEAALGEGQIEELIRMAKEEEALIPQMGGASHHTATHHSTVPRTTPACRPGSPRVPCRAPVPVATGFQQEHPTDRRLPPGRLAEWKPWEVAEGHSIPVERSDPKALPPAPKY